MEKEGNRSSSRETAGAGDLSKRALRNPGIAAEPINR
jgi:hypothetical protein